MVGDVKILKACLIRYPETGWNSDLDSALFSESALIEVIGEILGEYGKFPVPWKNEEAHDGLWVVGHKSEGGSRFIGHWETMLPGEGEFMELSVASEDLDDANNASRVIFMTYFQGLSLK